jgi:hypothetical protein
MEASGYDLQRESVGVVRVDAAGSSEKIAEESEGVLL